MKPSLGISLDGTWGADPSLEQLKDASHIIFNFFAAVGQTEFSISSGSRGGPVKSDGTTGVIPSCFHLDSSSPSLDQQVNLLFCC